MRDLMLGPLAENKVGILTIPIFNAAHAVVPKDKGKKNFG